MRKVRRVVVAFLPILAAGTLLAGPAATQAAAEPSAVRASAAGPVPLHSNAELARALARLARESHGRVTVTSAGSSNELRPIWLATVGNGPIRLLYVTQQHGDEPLGTESALLALRHLGLRNDAHTRWLRSRVTLAVIVRANPDGHERNWRYNFDPDAQPEFGEPGKGYDINRYHNPDVAPADNPVPEAAAIQRTWLRFRPVIVVDYHMQSRYVTPDGRDITTSVMWPTAAATAPGVVDRSKQVTVKIHDAMTAAGAVVTQYPGGDYEGIARNAYGLRGSASVLVELSDLGPARQQFQVLTAYLSMVALGHAAAAGSLDRVDPARADAIPPRGQPAFAGTGPSGSADLPEAA